MNLIRPICIYLALNNLNNKKIIKLKINKLVEDNIKLLYYFGNIYQKRHNLNKDEYNDLIQTAYFGLHRAAEKYDENKNVKFGSYASWWIRACMTKNVKDYYTKIKMLRAGIEPATLRSSVLCSPNWAIAASYNSGLIEGYKLW